jgi:hypothetical protein
VSTLTIPNTFVNGTTINAAPFNQNFGNIVTWSTAIDNTNIGPAGLFPNQLLPTTGAQATFGLTATGVGYTFLANDATATPLKAVGVSGQSANIFEVDLTAGGTKAVQIGASGLATMLGPIVLQSPGSGGGVGSTVYIANDAGATNGLLFNIPSASTNGFRFNVNATQVFQIGTGNVNTTLPINSTIAAALHTSNYEFQNNSGRTTAMGYSNIVSINTIGGTVWLVTDLANIDAAAIDTSGNLGIAGTLHQTSRRELKKRIEYIDPSEALEVVLATKIARYDFMAEEPQENGQTRHASFIADEAPWQLSGGPGREHADPQKTASYALAAIAGLHARVVALEGKLPTA